MSTPPITVISSSISRVSTSASAGARSASRNATSASAGNGNRSTTVQRTTKGSLRGSAAVCAAMKSWGKNQPSVMTAGMAPITTLGAPSHAANAGRMVVCEAKARPTMNRPWSRPRARTLRRRSLTARAR